LDEKREPCGAGSQKSFSRSIFFTEMLPISKFAIKVAALEIGGEKNEVV
jgi:hypothetical protein